MIKEAIVKIVDNQDLTYKEAYAVMNEIMSGETSATQNAAITRAILEGADRGPKRDTVLLNAGAALYAAGKAEDLAGGVVLAGSLIDSGKALAALEAVKSASRRV